MALEARAARCMNRIARTLRSCEPRDAVPFCPCRPRRSPRPWHCGSTDSPPPGDFARGCRLGGHPPGCWAGLPREGSGMISSAPMVHRGEWCYTWWRRYCGSWTWAPWSDTLLVGHRTDQHLLVDIITTVTIENNLSHYIIYTK